MEARPHPADPTREIARQLATWRLHIREYVRDMWGLIPQPCKPEYAERWAEVERASGETWERLKPTVTADWFGDFDGAEWRWHEFEKGRHLTWQQNLILMGIEKAVVGDASRHMSVRSGHGCGKSSTCSWVILWFLHCFYLSQAPCTAPTSHQMHDVLWKELAKWINRMPAEAQELFEWQHDYVRMRYEPESWFARARTSTKENTEAIAGVHADDVLIVVDEASGVPEQVFNTAEGAMTSGNVFIILIGNPVRTIGYFFDSHHRNAADWQLFAFNGEDSPIVDRAYVEAQAKRHGVGSAEYGIRVKGTFPGADLMDMSGYVQLIPRTRITVQPRMVIPGITDLFSGFIGRKFLGVDPAGEGKDKATYVLRDRFRAEKIFERATSNPREIAGDVLTFIDRFKLNAEDVVVDSFGVGSDVGKEVALASLGKLNIYTPLVGTKPGEEESYNGMFFQRKPDELQNSEAKPDEWDDLFLNLRALMYFRSRNWIVSGGVLVDSSVDNSDFANELVVIKYKRSLHGNRIQLMTKQEMLKLGILSPNIADAFALTFLRDMEDSNPQTQEERDRILHENEGMSEDDRFSAV